MFVAGEDRWPFELDGISLEPDGRTVVRWEEEPFVASPLVCLIEDGIVVDAADGTGTDEFMSQLHVSAVNALKSIDENSSSIPQSEYLSADCDVMIEEGFNMECQL